MAQRHPDWLRQARRDLTHARFSADEAHYEWAAFAALQAAEKACKALHLSLGNLPWDHQLILLLQNLPGGREVPPKLLDQAKALDKHFMTSRYPPRNARGTPRERYTRSDAEQAIGDAEAIVVFCSDLIR